MAASPVWKVYDAHGTYQGATKEIEGAAALLTLYQGGTIRYQHKLVVWTDGEDGDTAESYDCRTFDLPHIYAVAEAAAVRLEQEWPRAAAEARRLSDEA